MKLTIVTVVFNDKAGLERTYASLDVQLDTGFEWVVVDGGSNDGCVDYLQRLNEKFEVVWCSGKDDGIYDAMNKGVSMSSGNHILFLNAGDELFSEDVVGSFKEFSLSNASAVIYGGFVMVCGSKSLFRKPRSPEYIRHSLPTSHQAIFYPSDFLSSQKYDLSYKISSDYFITCSAYTKGVDFVIADMIVSKFYTGGVSSCNRGGVVSDMYKIQRDVMGLSFLFRSLSALRRYVNMTIVDLISKI